MDLTGSTARSVTVTVGDLPRNAASFSPAVLGAATRCGGREFEIVAAADDTELIVDFVVDAHSEETAREAGWSVLAAVGSECFVWSVAVLTPFTA